MFTYNKDELSGETVLALGSFDGLHRGHMKVLESTMEIAERRNLIPAVLLFDTHPKSVLEHKTPSVLLDEQVRDKMLKNLGFRIVKANFAEIKDLSPEEFILKIYCKLSVRGLCCGFNYHYGKYGAGNVSELSKECERYGIELSASDAVCYEGETVSSTRIRQAIEDGDMKTANAMLGRPFSYKLEVVEGDRRGRKLGSPTINQFFTEGFIEPKFGVYASRVKLGGEWYPAVTNVGVRPTIKTETLRSETYIIGFDGDLYGQKIEVFLFDYIRGEEDFGDLDKLKERIALDATISKEIYDNGQIEN